MIEMLMEVLKPYIRKDISLINDIIPITSHTKTMIKI